MNATVARKGDEDAGAVLIKQNLMNGTFTVLSQIRTGDGTHAWLKGTGADPVNEAAADAYIARQVGCDWDLWVIEIEDREGRLPFNATVV
jgi:GMP synthase (glutamine-hydrolysing)